MRFTSIEKAVLEILKPLTRIALKRGMGYGEFSDLVKRAYVDVVQSDFKVPGRKLSASRIAVLTGLTRRTAGQLMREQVDPEAGLSRRRFNRAARVLAGWATDPAFRDGRGAPVSLPFENPDGPSFSSLVRSHRVDVPPRAVLDELLRVGAVGYLKDGRVRPLQRGYVPTLDEDEKIAILGSDVADLIASIEHNLDEGSSEPFFQRKVAYDNLPPDYLPKLKKHVARDAQRLLERLNSSMSSQDRDLMDSSREEGEPGRNRAMVGIYYFDQPVEEDE